MKKERKSPRVSSHRPQTIRIRDEADTPKIEQNEKITLERLNKKSAPPREAVAKKESTAQKDIQIQNPIADTQKNGFVRENSERVNSVPIQRKESMVQNRDKIQTKIGLYKSKKNISFTSTFVTNELTRDTRRLDKGGKEKQANIKNGIESPKDYILFSHIDRTFTPHLQQKQKSIIKKILPIQNQKEPQEPSGTLFTVMTSHIEHHKRELVSSDENRFSQLKVESDTSFTIQNSHQNGGYDTSQSQENFHESYQESDFQEHSSDMQNFLENIGQRQNISLRLDKTFINVNLQTNMVHLSFVTHQSGILGHTNVHNIVDTIMKESGFDNYKVILKDKKRRIDISSAYTKRKVSPQRKSIDVKV